MRAWPSRWISVPVNRKRHHPWRPSLSTTAAAAITTSTQQRPAQLRVAVLPPIMRKVPTASPIEEIRPELLADPAPPDDMRLVDFLEQVRIQLWKADAMPLKRFHIRSLLRRLYMPPLETWSNALPRATADCPRTFSRTLLARQEPASSLPSLPAHVGVEAPGFDLLLLCWRPGAASVIHDHPKAGCWVKVLKGEIKDTRYSLPRNSSSRRSRSSDNKGHDSGGSGVGDGDSGSGEGGGMVQTSSITCSVGTVSYIEDSMGLHKMENPSLTEECISLHLYSPGISECTTWADASCASMPVKKTMCLDGNFADNQEQRRFNL